MTTNTKTKEILIAKKTDVLRQSPYVNSYSGYEVEELLLAKNCKLLYTQTEEDGESQAGGFTKSKDLIIELLTKVVPVDESKPAFFKEMFGYCLCRWYPSLGRWERSNRQ